MKKTLITITIIFVYIASTAQAEVDVQKLLDKVDVSHPYYGKAIYGAPKINIFRSQDNSVLLIYQARYGGDGEHTENLLKMFKFNGEKAVKKIDQNIDFVEFVEETTYLKSIHGKYVETLCDTCDGWEVSAPEDIFLIPISIDVDTQLIKPEISKKDKTKLISRLKQQAKENIKEQLSYGRKNYPAFVASVKKRILKLLNKKNDKD